MKSDHTLWCWGNGLPIAAVSVGASVAKVSVGAAHACALTMDGALWCWGSNGSGQLGDGTYSTWSVPVFVEALGNEVTAVIAADDYTCASKNDGTLWCWGTNTNGQLGGPSLAGCPVRECSSSPQRVPAVDARARQFAAGSMHACAVKPDGTLWCWGANPFGQFGDGTTAGQFCDAQLCDLGALPIAMARVPCP